MKSRYTFSDADLAGRPEALGITIDGPDTLDIDDAVFVEENAEATKVIVTIADVAFGVGRGSEDDMLAYQRGVTEYLANGTKPMLRRALSEDALSLFPGVWRPGVTITTTLDAQGEIADVTIARTKIRSKARMTYDRFTQLVDRGDEDAGRWYRLAQRLMTKRRDSGAVFFFDDEHNVAFDDDGRPVAVKASSFKAQLLIQEFMILTNRAVALFALEYGVPLLFRNHRSPEGPVDIEDAMQRFMTAQHDGDVAAMRDIENEVMGRMGRARYEPESKGHFGLSLGAYCHFTSPIRRYADLINHRLVLSFVEKHASGYSYSGLLGMAAHLNRRADEVKKRRGASYTEAALRESWARVADSERRTDAPTVEDFSKLERHGMLGEETMAQKAQAYEARLRVGMLDSIAMGHLLIDLPREDELWQPLHDMALAHLAEHDRVAVQLLMEATQKRAQGWHSLKFKDRLEDGKFAVEIDMVCNGNPVVVVGPLCTTKADAKAQACVALWHEYLGRDYVPPKPLPEPVRGPSLPAQPAANPVGALNERAQKGRFSVDYDFSRTGPDHAAVFKAVVTLSGGKFEEPVVVEAAQPGRSQQEAKELAARAALAHLDGAGKKATVSAAASSSGAAQEASSNAGRGPVYDLTQQNPVSVLMEFCAAKKLATPTEDYDRQGADHMPSFGCKIRLDYSQEAVLVGAGVAGSKKEAKAGAARNLLAQLAERGLIVLKS